MEAVGAVRAVGADEDAPQGDIPPGDASPDDAPPGEWPRYWPVLLLGAAVVPGTAVVLLGRWADGAAVAAWRTVCLAVVVQALPFLLLGTALSGAINAFVPERVFTRLLPKRPGLAVPVAGVAGVVLPGCECASVPVANSLIGRGVTPAAAFAFLLSAPAINPVVLTATAIAFPGHPDDGAGPAGRLARHRRGDGLAVALASAGRSGCGPPYGTPGTGRGTAAGRSSGAASSTTPARRRVPGRRGHGGGHLQCRGLPRSVLDTFSGSPWLSVLFLAALAVLLAVCSEADAFVASSLMGFSPHRPADLHGGARWWT